MQGRVRRGGPSSLTVCSLIGSLHCRLCFGERLVCRDSVSRFQVFARREIASLSVKTFLLECRLHECTEITLVESNWIKSQWSDFLMKNTELLS